MGTIRRAAVTGLFAAWLAPLAGSADNPSAGRKAGGDLRVERRPEPVAEPDRRADPGEVARRA
jgi:hypothetical protein